jgi:uncharacterized protein with PIN domain
VTHSYLTRGSINAKRFAPWYALALDKSDTEWIMVDEEEGKSSEKDGTTDEKNLVNGLGDLNIVDRVHRLEMKDEDESPHMRYLLDSSLNKLCRWLRILGQDVALETDEEEKLRPGHGEMIMFERCRTEQRTLVTTSPRLMQRRDCPPSVYCVHPPFLSQLEVALVHMLLTHGVVLEPSTFLSRCVVCNGNIVEVEDEAEKRRILIEYEAPPDLIDDGMAVYECDGCRQGYWWNDRPTSSASRVKTAATRLMELCVRGGVPIKDGDDCDGLFQHVRVEELRHQGWDYESPGSELLHQRLDVIDWLKQEHLQCPFALESAYAHRVLSSDNANAFIVHGEILPFTNVTHQFVDTLDYIFFDKTLLKATERLFVPSSFRELGDERTYIENAHLLPSDVWPSDHLAIGARLSFLADVAMTKETNDIRNATASSTFSEAAGEDDERATPRKNDDAPTVEPNSTDLDDQKANKVANSIENNNAPTVEPEVKDHPLPFCAPIGGASSPNNIPFPPIPQRHGQRCACGCVPAIPSLFEMAEMRKQARLKASTVVQNNGI